MPKPVLIRYSFKAHLMKPENVRTSSLDNNAWKGIALSDSAVQQIIKLMKKTPKAKGLRLGVKKSGCAGFVYSLDFICHPSDDELLFERDGAKLYVPLKAMFFIDGTTVYFVQEGLNQMFKFKNPKAQHACGCGESFSV